MNIWQSPFVDSTLSRSLSKWRFYKRAFIFFVCVNVFSLTASLVLAVKYFGFQHNYGAQQRAEIQRVALVDAGLGELQAFMFELHGHSALDLRTSQDEQHILQQLEAWQRIKNYARDIQANPIPQDFTPLINTPENETRLKQIVLQFQSIKASAYTTLETRLTHYRSNMRELILIGFITLLFGLILPCLCLKLLARGLNHVRLEMQANALQLAREWTTAQLQFGENAFRNIEFWLQIGCLAGEQARHLSYHPAAQVASEIAYLMRQELANHALQRARSKQADNEVTE